MINFTEFTYDALDSGSQVDVAYTDFQKAFDKIDHLILIKKLHNFGLSDNLITFFASYLENRQQYVSRNNFKSKTYSANSGIPQGSNLGPLLFNIFINDVTEKIAYSKIILYADDLKLFKQIDSVQDVADFQCDLSTLQNWSQENKLKFNLSKCYVMTYTRKLHPFLEDYKISDKILTRVSSISDLGVIFDQKLTFNDHILSTIKKASSLLGFIIRNAKNFTDINVIKLLYFSLVRSRLEFASIIWHPNYFMYDNLVEKVQKKFLRYLFFKQFGYYTYLIPYSQHLKTFHMTSLSVRRRVAGLMYIYGLINGHIDDNATLSTIALHVPTFYSRSPNVFNIPRSRTVHRASSPIQCV